MAGDLLDFGIMKSMQALKKSRNDLASADASLAEALTAEKIAIKFDKAMTEKNARLAVLGDKCRLRVHALEGNGAALKYLLAEIKRLGGDEAAAFDKVVQIRKSTYIQGIRASVAKGVIKFDPFDPNAPDEYKNERKVVEPNYGMS